MKENGKRLISNTKPLRSFYDYLKENGAFSYNNPQSSSVTSVVVTKGRKVL